MQYLRQALFNKYSWIFICGLCIWIWLLLSTHSQSSEYAIGDFYPVYVAGRAFLNGIDPYSDQIIQELSHTWNAPYASAGFAYPLPIIVLILPILVLPYIPSMICWMLFGLVSSFAAIDLQKHWRPLIALPFCFLPLYNATVAAQATLIWFGLAVLLLLGIKYEKVWLIGICIALLPIKPQTGIIFALVGIWWVWRKQAWSALIWAGITGSLIWGGSFLLQPSWLQDWLMSLKRYDEVVYTEQFWLWGLILLVTTWHLPWYARLSVLQVLLFPITSLYSFAPLLLVWVALGGPIAYIGSLISWAIIVFNLPYSTIVFVGTILLPLIVCTGWEAQKHWTGHRQTVPN
jgi:hypothetical protein